MKGITLIIAFGMICVSNSTEIFASESEPCTESSRTVYYNAYTQALQEAEETGSENEIEKQKMNFQIMFMIYKKMNLMKLYLIWDIINSK